MPSILKLNQVKKTYGQQFHLGPFNLDVAQGDCLAVIGINGSGKSTFFQMITGNLEATSGEIFLGSQKVVIERFDLKRQFGYLPQNTHLPPWINGFEALTYAGSLLGITDEKIIEAKMQYWDCASYRYTPIDTCSYGMQKRISLALATLHDPHFLILDEPFSGLDLNHTFTLEKYLRQRQTKNQTTLLSTHVSPYIIRLCNRVVAIDKGKVFELTDWQGLSSEEKEQQIERAVLSSS